MVYDRNNRNRDTEMDYGRDYGSGRDYTQSSARDYSAAGWNDRGDNGRYGDDRFENRSGYGQGGYGQGGYGQGGYSQGGGRGYGERSGGYGRDDYGRQGGRDDGWQAQGRGGDRFGRSAQGRGGYGQGQGGRARDRDYDYDDRGFFARAGDEVRSWFGDDEAERRRDLDQRYDQQYGSDSDRDYGEWRRGQIAALDRDYDEYRRENQSKFHSEFGSWRSDRQTQRSSLDKVGEHMEVVGSDGQHVGTVDKVRGDKIILTKTDQDAGGHHHSIPSRWIQSVDDKVTIRKTADEAKREWKDVERRGAMFGDDGGASGYGAYGGSSAGASAGSGPRALNRSFSGTYDKDS